GLPDEACGLITGDAHAHEGGRPIRLLPLPNAAGSPYRYLIDARAQLAAMLDIDGRGEVVWGIFHSHVASAAAPSATDIGLAVYPDSLYVICSLASDPPGIRAWSIREGDVAEVLLQVD
nr:M67 family metallopeptidase [Chloroflexota bacterium]